MGWMGLKSWRVDWVDRVEGLKGGRWTSSRVDMQGWLEGGFPVDRVDGVEGLNPGQG